MAATGEAAAVEFKTHEGEGPLHGIILGAGNPLLDISAEVPMAFCEKYGAKMNNAILAEEQHLPIFKELEDNFPVVYVAGGATQNAIRVAQWMIQEPGRTAYIGSVGEDAHGETLEKVAKSAGVQVHYAKTKEAPTGTCAVLVHEGERSLIANLGAANLYNIDHLNTEASQELLKKAAVVYSAGFFLTVSPASMMAMGEHCAKHNKVYAINLAAPFLCQFFMEPMMKVMPYADIVFGNESEAAAFAAAHGMTGAPIIEVAKFVAALPKASGYRCRMVVFTQGGDDIITVRNGRVQSWPVRRLPKEEIVDVNGAGDAFVGGFLAKYLQGKRLEDCVRAGQYSASVVIRRPGCTLPEHPPDI